MFATLRSIQKSSLSRLRATAALGICVMMGVSLMGPFPSAHAAQIQGIAAVVNDEVISNYDLEQRMRLLMATGSIRPNEENFQRLQQQVLQSLVDEKLQLQEARRLELKIKQTELDAAVSQIANRSGRTAEQIVDILENAGVRKEALLDQLRASIAWQKVTARLFAPQVTISEEEIDEMISRMEADRDKMQYQISEIVLSFDNPNQEREMMMGAQRLVEQIRRGAPFQAVAQQFSQAASANKGGDIGWVAEPQLPENAREIIKNTALGAVTDPIRTTNAIHIYYVRSAQEGLGPNPMRHQFGLLRALFPAGMDSSNAQLAAADRKAQKAMEGFRTCKAFATKVKQLGGQVDDPRTVFAGQLRDPLRGRVLASEAGSVLGPLRSQQGFELFAICDRKDDLGTNVSRESIEENLFTQKASMVARRHLRDLRRDAIVDTKVQ